MTRKCLAAILALGLSGLSATVPARAAEPAPPAQTVLEASAKAYLAVPALRDTMTYVVEAPGSEKEPKKLEYGFGAGTDAYVKDPLLAAVATGDKLYLTRSDAPGAYVAVPYGGDFGAALNGIVGDQGSLFEPPPVAMRTGKGIDAWIDSMRFKLLAPPLRIASNQRITGPGGKALDEIRFEADNGQVTLRLDAKTHFFASMTAEMRPPGAPAGTGIHIDATFDPQVLPSAAGVVRFEPGNRNEVKNLAALTSNRLAPGSPAPDFTLETLDGRKVLTARPAGLRRRARLLGHLVRALLEDPARDSGALRLGGPGKTAGGGLWRRRPGAALHRGREEDAVRRLLEVAEIHHAHLPRPRRPRLPSLRSPRPPEHGARSTRRHHPGLPRQPVSGHAGNVEDGGPERTGDGEEGGEVGGCPHHPVWVLAAATHL